MTWTRQVAGIPVGKVVKRILKRPLLWLLRALSDEVETNWQRGQGPRP